VYLEGVEDWADYWPELPSFKMVSDQTIGELPERSHLDEVEQFVDTQIGNVEIDRIEIR
jgi:hypothetical protein